ncbi:methylmalonyl-CoA mutase [Fervidicella metallireducens AeB]|uniref:Methylmalonyl-CoA mutase n=1 Tax=Fervidicella metallireducens AeB TaxID=1403537 RepID=A0A017RTE2_9CLOT|nr:methylmalonyl-CoA mutase family protein [Fervidicella metallireducens]EYE87932.1 methylmalonyl-CoA mutase [Fervidicella metallireducens AeB]
MYKDIAGIEVAKRKWEEKKLRPTIEKAQERKKEFRTTSDITVNTVYTPKDVENTTFNELGFPGEYPFTRGIQPNMYRGKFWTMRQYAGYSTAEESNKRYKYLLNQGTTGLSVAFDLPTQVGLDSDSGLSLGEVGKVGVAIDSLYDMEVLFDGIPLDKISTSMTINAPSIVLLAMYLAVAKKQGVPFENLRGTIQNDILKEYAARGTYIFPVKPSLRLITDIFEYCSKNVPKWNTISISGYHIREAGATAVQELAFTFANAIEYVRAAINKGLDVDDFAPQLSFFFNAHNNLFEEVAKFRAARRVWAKIMKEWFGAKKEKSMMLRFHTQTAGCTLTAQQIDNNIVRVTLQTLAAVLGGTQSLHTNSRDEALALPTEESVRIALRTQQIVAYESGVCDTVDPLGGSFYIESLTNEIERKVFEYINKIEEMGGAAKAIEVGYIQKEISDSAYKYQREIEDGEKIVVGVNKFQIQEHAKKDILKVSREAEENQKTLLKKIKKDRDNEKVKESLEKLRNAASTDENLMPYVLDAVLNYATLGEICGVLRDVFGEYRQTIVI